MLFLGNSATQTRRGGLSPSATGLAAQLRGDAIATGTVAATSAEPTDSHGCVKGETWDDIERFCRPAPLPPPVSPGTLDRKRFMVRSVQISPTSSTKPLVPSRDIVAPSPPPSFIIPTPQPLPPSLSPAVQNVVFVPEEEEDSFLDKTIVGPVKVKHALIGSAVAGVGLIGMFMLRGGR